MSGQILTSRQAEELHKAIIAYLSSNELHNTAEALRQELDLGESFDATTSKKYEGLLEKKWTSVVRLQKKVRARSDGRPRSKGIVASAD